jgi:phytoene dehydrogenase-like protein
VNILPLIFNVRTKSIEKLFEERETDTETALIERWGFSDDIINKFFKPFLEGIYLTPLSKQSSRMFSFVFKMFSEGAATLPEGGIGAVATQLEEKAKKLGVEI